MRPICSSINNSPILFRVPLLTVCEFSSAGTRVYQALQASSAGERKEEEEEEERDAAKASEGPIVFFFLIPCSHALNLSQKGLASVLY